MKFPRLFRKEETQCRRVPFVVLPCLSPSQCPSTHLVAFGPHPCSLSALTRRPLSSHSPEPGPLTCRWSLSLLRLCPLSPLVSVRVEPSEGPKGSSQSQTWSHVSGGQCLVPPIWPALRASSCSSYFLPCDPPLTWGASAMRSSTQFWKVPAPSCPRLCDPGKGRWSAQPSVRELLFSRRAYSPTCPCISLDGFRRDQH